MSLKKYEAFAKTVELGSLTRAAEALGYTQSGISHIMRSLEEDFGFTLLIRGHSRISLTEAGEQTLPMILAVLGKEQALRSMVDGLHGAVTGTIRVGTFTSVAVHWLPGVIMEFQKTYPGVDFKIFNGDYYDVDKWLREEEIDLGFITLPAPDGVRCIPLLQDRLMAILPKGHRLEAMSAIPIAEAAREPFISLLESSDHDIRRAMDKAGVKPNVKFSIKDDYALIAMVAQGLGISIVPELLLQGRQDDVSVRDLSPSTNRTIALAIPEGKKQIPAVERFAACVVDWLKEPR